MRILAIVLISLIAGCTYGPRVLVPDPSNDLGQDVPNPNPTVVQCADPLHQNRPGGLDYNGPAVPECPNM